ncbi:SDR family oxidoreductase [Mesorhizobium sp. M1E.F.Ca.ET.045.02.1.1]|uniref:SDR family oxidoreductase n=1 Tax=unclassified Mesorhizobium TaxID=325217 RepID=UPI000F762F5C|nr:MULTISPECIES: SDR family oxidoreductase [unclassified Mesorhizobium]AZO23466.1 SDR family oxidoreductase [Mesorhizobium sp. M1E.F.Ca.ET.045.02.1.1]RUW75969.1 NAD-dependent epimerase/dehydratase family protein [Mesorhizobium sp. M1E.F.Ca.ET.063.01.1.1]
MKVLVLGGYGLIGEAVLERLIEDGHDLVGLGRDVVQARRRKPRAQWIAADMSRLLAAADWIPLLAGVEAVVNAAGALQDGSRDHLDAIHRRSVAALVTACEQAGVRRLVQISAIGADLDSDNAFFRTKAEGDRAVASSSLEWTILRPGLVIAQGAYGGTALLRALAAFPWFVPAVLADRPIQTVSVADVAEAVSRAVGGSLARGQIIDLVEERARPLGAVLLEFRAWLGLPKAPVVAVPAIVGRLAGIVADRLGLLGWRSPLRSAALAALEKGVTGNPKPWAEITGRPPQPLEATLAVMPAHVQERWFARLWLLKPIVFAILSTFWLASGVVGLARHDAAADILVSRGLPPAAALGMVLAGSVADIVVGAAVVVRPLARLVLLAMVAITLLYLAAATMLAPDLWLDPLGAIVKAVPMLCLVLVALAILEER